MNFKQWRAWVRSKPWNLKWFILLIILRPIIDNFYFLKETNILLSPLYWVGLITPFLCLWGINNSIRYKSIVMPFFKIWAFFVFLSVILIATNFNDNIINYLMAILKLTLPFFIFLFCLHFIKNSTDLLGILQAFVYSLMFVILLLGYEIFITPVRVTFRSEDVSRIQGNFGDVASYGLYLSIGLLTILYFNLKDRVRKKKSNKYIFVITIIILIIALPELNHAATTLCLLLLLALFIYFVSKRNLVPAILLLISLIFIWKFFGEEIYNNFILPLYQKDIEVISGKANPDALFHGRVGRWEQLIKIWVELPLFAKLFGIPSSYYDPGLLLVSGTHNDFVRYLFFIGVFGLISYLTLLFVILRQILKLHDENLFLGLGAFFLLVLFSITLTPTLYPNFIYVIFSIFAFASLPKRYQT